MSRNTEQGPPLWGESYERARLARPFLKWAGGKQRFLQLHAALIPTFSGKYLEPFLGGGAVFFYLMRHQERPFRARLGDVNRQLIRCYLQVRDDPVSVHEQLEVLQAGYSAATDKARYYYDVRDAFNRQGITAPAAAFIFLNQTCWNGLWRVNQYGKLNVPYGAPKTDVVIPSIDHLLNASSALQSSKLRATSWEHTTAFAEPGDFVFMDPPYFSDSLVRDNVTTKYGRNIFGYKDHVRLAESARDLKRRGVAFLLTNSAEPEMLKLYESLGLAVTRISIPRVINSRGDERQAVAELLVGPGDAESPSLSGVAQLALHALVTRRRRDPPDVEAQAKDAD